LNLNREQCCDATEVYVQSMTTGMDRLQQLLAHGTGHKRLDDDLFKKVDNLLKIYRREGVFEIEEQSKEPEYIFVLYIIE